MNIVPALGRQHVPRHGVHQHRRRVVALGEHRRGAAQPSASSAGPTLKAQWDTSGSYGGPSQARPAVVLRDGPQVSQSARIEETSIRRQPAIAGDPNSWAVRASIPAIEEVAQRPEPQRLLGPPDGSARQAPRCRSRSEHQYRCDGSTLITQRGRAAGSAAPTGPRSGQRRRRPKRPPGTSRQPVLHRRRRPGRCRRRNRLLLEAGFSRLAYRAGVRHARRPTPSSTSIPVTEQRRHRRSPAPNNTTIAHSTTTPTGTARTNNFRASATYVTGAHNMKVGYRAPIQAVATRPRRTNSELMRYRFNQRSPQSVHDQPAGLAGGRPHGAALGLRTGLVDAQAAHTAGSHPLRPRVQLEPCRTATERRRRRRWNAQPIDVRADRSACAATTTSPRAWGVAYDLFGTGKTALKWNIGKSLRRCHQRQQLHRQQPCEPHPAIDDA